MSVSEARPTTRIEHEDAIPAVVKRNTLLLAMTQACVGIGNQMIPTLGAITIVQLTGALALAGLTSSILGGTRFLVAYPMGTIMDRCGRRAGLALGIVLVALGGLTIGLSVVALTAVGFLFGITVFGCGVSAIQQLRLAAADMYPPHRRGEGMGYVLTGSLVGAALAPLVVSAAQALAPRLGLDALALGWLLVPPGALASLGLVALIRPDPREIALNLQRWYPHYTPPPRLDGQAGFREFVREYPKQTAFVASFAAQGNMTMMMAMTSLALAHHGHELPAISLAVAIHVLGMFGLSIPLGRLSDHVGRRNTMLLGLAAALVGGLQVAFLADYWQVTLGTFLVGMGWSGVTVGATALIADTTPPALRGRAVGTNDALSAAGSAVLPLLGGAVVAALGLPALAVVSGTLMIAPTILLLRLHEPSPGKYIC